MRAYVRLDPVDQIVEVAEVAAPVADAEEVVVAVHAFGVGVHDRYFIPSDVSFPYIVGLEAAGVVTAVGAQVAGINLGDRVMVTSVGNRKGGTWADFAAVDQRGVKAIPEALDFVTAAGIPIGGDAAVESWHTLGMNAGETLYVAGASGAIGTLVVQMAAQRGIRVVGSASAANHDYVLSLGAELVVDYRDPEWPDKVRRWAPGGVDAALAIQPNTPEPSQDVVRDGGHLVTVSGDPCAPQRGIRVEQFPHRADPSKEMAELVTDISTGRIRLVLEHVYPFDQALSALEKTETRHARGKLVVKVR
ncbi:MAG: NADP-dependent oxidoreductase [Nocardioidaceae bacterium]